MIQFIWSALVLGATSGLLAVPSFARVEPARPQIERAAPIRSYADQQLYAFTEAFNQVNCLRLRRGHLALIALQGSTGMTLQVADLSAVDGRAILSLLHGRFTSDEIRDGFLAAYNAFWERRVQSGMFDDTLARIAADRSTVVDHLKLEDLDHSGLEERIVTILRHADWQRERVFAVFWSTCAP